MEPLTTDTICEVHDCQNHAEGRCWKCLEFFCKDHARAAKQGLGWMVCSDCESKCEIYRDCDSEGIGVCDCCHNLYCEDHGRSIRVNREGDMESVCEDCENNPPYQDHEPYA